MWIRISTMIHSLMGSMSMENATNLVVLNSNSPLPGRNQIYGYRTGFANYEIQKIQQHKEQLLKLITEINSKVQKERASKKDLDQPGLFCCCCFLKLIN